MAEKNIRIGRVSKVNYEKGMIEVTYPDMDNCVTDELPVCSFNDEYKMPAIGKEVLVLHLSNGSVAGAVLGPYWNKKNAPAQSAKGLYRKELGEIYGEAYMRYFKGIAEIKSKSIVLSCDTGSISTEQIIGLFARVAALEARL